MRPIRVVLGDDHTLVRQGIKAFLASSPIRIEGEAGDGRALIREVRTLLPDVALVDVSMPLLNGIEATRQIGKVSPQTRVIMLSMFYDKGYIAQARRAGAWGYVLKEEAPERLIEAIEVVAKGQRYFPKEMEANAEPASAVKLTPREREVLQLVAEGKKNNEIAQLMMRSPHTVRNHRARLMRKLRVRRVVDLVRAAGEMGLVRIDTPKEHR
jgi:DNA-binding NarL/FixJ family response regulator